MKHWKNIIHRGGESTLARRGELDEEGPPAAWLAEEAERRRVAFEGMKERHRRDELSARKQATLSQRLGAVERELLLGSQVSAPVGSAGGSVPADSKAPPPADHLEHGAADPRELSRLFRLAEDVIGKLEAILDEGAGYSRPMFTEELDKLLFITYKGYSPDDVAILEPALGSPAAVRKSRRLAGLQAETGDPVTKKR